MSHTKRKLLRISWSAADALYSVLTHPPRGRPERQISAQGHRLGSVEPGAESRLSGPGPTLLATQGSCLCTAKDLCKHAVHTAYGHLLSRHLPYSQDTLSECWATCWADVMSESWGHSNVYRFDLSFAIKEGGRAGLTFPVKTMTLRPTV